MPFPKNVSYNIIDSAELEDDWVLGLIWWFRDEWQSSSLPRVVGVMLVKEDTKWVGMIGRIPVQTQEEFEDVVEKYRKFMTQLVVSYQYGRQYIDDTFPINVWNTAAKARKKERAEDVEKYVQYILKHLHRGSIDIEMELQHMTATRVFEIVNELDPTIQFNRPLMEAAAQELRDYVNRIGWALRGEKPDREVYEKSQEMFQSLEYDDMTNDQLLDLRNELGKAPQVNVDKIRLVDEALRRRTSGFRPRLIPVPSLKKVAAIANHPLANIEIRF